MKILLVSPVSKAGNGGFVLGLMYISAMLKANGYDRIEGYDLMYDKEAACLESAANADLVGFYCTTRTFLEVKRLSRLVKKRNPGSRVMVGGPHATLRPDEVIGVESIDFVGIGEGEYTVLELVRCLDGAGDGLEAIPGMWWKTDGDVVHNAPREVLRNLDSLPFPDWDLFDRNHYYYGLATPIASRGCPFNCINCMPALTEIAGPYRRRSVGNVMAELQMLNARYGYDHFFFQDNDIAVSRKWISALCKEIIESGLKIKWHALARVTTIDRELVALLKRAGCSHLNIGAESGSERVIGLLNKKISLDQVRDAVTWCNEVGLETTVFFMIGIPGETLQEMWRTIEFGAALGADDLMISVAQPVPHTHFEKICLEHGWLLTNDPDDFDTPDPNGGMQCWIRTDQWGPAQVVELKHRARQLLKKSGWMEIDRRFLFRNFNTILKKRNWRYVISMSIEELRKFRRSGSLACLKMALYFPLKKTALCMGTGGALFRPGAGKV